jgi:hypothetical protein
MQNPLTLFNAWLARKRAARLVKAAEQQRAAIMAQIAERRARKAEWKPLGGLLRQATEASLRASVRR